VSIGLTLTGWRLRLAWARNVHGYSNERDGGFAAGGRGPNGHFRFFYGPNAERKAARDRRRRA
jgi:hypothetical protein